MSLLLDALNKADQERKRNEATPGINSNHENTFDHGARNKSIVLVALIAIGLGLLFATIYWLGQRSATSATATASTSATVKSSAVPQKSLAAEQTATMQANRNNTEAENSSGTDTSEEKIDTSEENVASLYQQNTAAQSTNATLTLPAPTANVPTTDVNSAPSGASPTSITQFANLPDLHDLPSQVLEKIPSLNYSEHNYNSNGGSVKINGNIHHANDQLSNGLVIDKILEDGMVLHMENYSFKMRALNSWVNM